MMKILILLAMYVLLASGDFVSRNCTEICDKSKCPDISQCQAGVVKDRCDCCHICGAKESERCFESRFRNLPSNFQQYNPCGDELDCRLRDDLDENDPPEAICYCRDEDPVCGSDGITYENVCKLIEKRYRERSSLSFRNRGPCDSAPIFSLKPQSVVTQLRGNAVFSCEVSGYPSPRIFWRKSHDTDSNRMINIPPENDNAHYMVQSRADSKRTQITSWLQIVDIRTEDRGLYHCVAENQGNEAIASATLFIQPDESVLGASSQR